MFDSYRGISPEAKYLIYQSVLPAVAYGMFYTDISYFSTTVQGLSIEFMGLVVTVMGISTFAASIPFGMAAHRYGRKKMLIAGNVIAGLIIALFALTTNPTLLLLAASLRVFLRQRFQLQVEPFLLTKPRTAEEQRFFSFRVCPKHCVWSGQFGYSGSCGF